MATEKRLDAQTDSLSEDSKEFFQENSETLSYFEFDKYFFLSSNIQDEDLQFLSSLAVKGSNRSRDHFIKEILPFGISFLGKYEINAPLSLILTKEIDEPFDLGNNIIMINSKEGSEDGELILSVSITNETGEGIREIPLQRRGSNHFDDMPGINREDRREIETLIGEGFGIKIEPNSLYIKYFTDSGKVSIETTML